MREGDLPPIDEDRRAHLRRMDDVAMIAAKAHAAEALTLAHRWRRTVHIVIVLAGLLFIFGFYRIDEQNEEIRANQREACDARVELTIESNQRVNSLERDRDNLIALTEALARNRALEARAFEAIGREFRITEQVDELVELLERASRRDQEILRSAAAITYERLPVIDCKEALRDNR